MRYGVRCPNMNHGRTNAPVKFCPMCGDSVNRAAAGSCDHARHADLRKNRHVFCPDCGKKLSLN
jgi:rRNA maturation endonuclease Nob1